MTQRISPAGFSITGPWYGSNCLFWLLHWWATLDHQFHGYKWNTIIYIITRPQKGLMWRRLYQFFRKFFRYINDKIKQNNSMELNILSVVMHFFSSTYWILKDSLLKANISPCSFYKLVTLWSLVLNYSEPWVNLAVMRSLWMPAYNNVLNTLNKTYRTSKKTNYIQIRFYWKVYVSQVKFSYR